MKRLLQRAVFVSMLPLGLSVAALGLRQATYEPYHPAVAQCSVTAFTPPPAFVLASNAPAGELMLRVDVAHSTARVTTGGRGGATGEQLLRVTGTLRILADETLADLELDLVPHTKVRAYGWPADLELHLRGVAARSRATAVAGVRACSLRCSAVIGGSSHDSLLEVTWIRLPAGEVRLHAVTPLDGPPFDPPEPWLGRLLPRDEDNVLGLDLVLRAER